MRHAAALTVVAIIIALVAGFRLGLYAAMLRLSVGANRCLSPGDRAVFYALMDRALIGDSDSETTD